MTDAATENLSKVARRLEELGIDDVAFVGGAMIGLLLTDPAAPPPRATFDVDVVTPVRSRVAYNRIEERLRRAGFSQSQEEGAPICRWLIDGIPVDLMPSAEDVLGFSNRWYPALLRHARPTVLPDGTATKLATAPYLVATKLEAFRGRGAGDYRMSHDLEDIIVLLDGRAEVVEEVKQAPADVRGYIAGEFRRLLADGDFVDAVAGHLPPDTASQARASTILDRMRQVVSTED